jgi:hypothetical protein
MLRTHKKSQGLTEYIVLAALISRRPRVDRRCIRLQ